MLLNMTEQYKKYDLPLDVVWSDIDYMLNYEDFSINENAFPLDQMKKITDNYHYACIIDAGIKVSGVPYEEGKKRDVFIKDIYGKEYQGEVWPGNTTFVDFFHPNASKYWEDMLVMLR